LSEQNPSQQPKAPWRPAPGGRPNTVGLHERELGELLDRFDIPEEGGRPNPRRDFVRWPFRRTSVQMRLTHPTGAVSTIQVACRNISRGGLSALHNTYLHPGTRCRMLLPHPQAGQKAVDGLLVRCIHRSGVIHELGISFQEPIDVREFVTPDPLADFYSLERVTPENLTGTVLFADASEIDRKIFRHFLRETHMRIITAGSGEEAIAQIDESCDLVVCDLAIVRNPQFILSLRERSHAPLIVTSSDTSPEVRRLLGETPAEAFLSKPLAQRLVLRAIAEFLIARRTGKVVKTGASLPDDVVPHLSQNFIASLADYVVRLGDAARRNDPAVCRNLCLQLSGTAPTVGFKPLGRLAATAAQLLSRSQSVPASLHAIRSVIAACERAGSRAA
jgi:CheY-like chemotaxis protein